MNIKKYLDENYSFLNLKEFPTGSSRFKYLTVDGQKESDFAIIIEEMWNGVLIECRIIENNIDKHDFLTMNTIESFDKQMTQLEIILENSVYVIKKRRDYKIDQILE